MMMKKWTALLCALTLLLAAMPALGEAASPYECLLAVYDRTGEGDHFLGMAVCCDGHLLIPAQAFATASEPYLAGAGYTLEISSIQSGGPIAVITPKTDEPLPSLTAAPCVAGEPVMLLAVTPDGMSRMTGSALSPVTVDGTVCYLTDSTGPAPLGTAVLSAEGALVGLIGAMWGEGHNTYLVLPVADAPSAASPASIQDDSLVNNKQPGGKSPADGSDAPTDDAAPASEATPDSGDAASENWLSPLTATAHGHWITVDWSHCDLSKAGPDSQVVVYIEDADNLYYSWLADSAAVGSMEVPAVPGRFYTIGARLFDSMPEDDDALRILGLPAGTSVAVDTPEAKPFNRYGYRDTELFLGTLPAGMSEDAAMLLQAEPIPSTLDALRQEGKDVYLQATSKYRVKRDQECNMMVTLTTPENCVYHLEGLFLFIDGLSDGDVWNCNLQPLLDLYAEHNGGMSRGEYTVRYYFEGTLVNTLVFHAD